MPAFFLGIDASKGYADFILLDQKKQPRETSFQLDDTFEGHNQLYRILQAFCKAHPQARLWAGIESTGGYENNWIEALRRFQASLPLQVARLNPSGVHGHAKAALRRLTTDAISAQNVAEYLINHPEQVIYKQQDSLASLRRQWSLIQLLTRQRTALLAHLESMLYTGHPEVLRYAKDGPPAWLLKLVVRYPTARRVARAKAQSLAKIPYLSLDRAQALIETAQRSIASADDQTTEELLRETARQILHLGRVIKQHTETMTQALGLPEEIDLLKSFQGIGDYAAVGLLLEIQSVERFASAKKLASFFGLHPVYKQSGDGLGAMRMSKQGSKKARALLYMVTLTAIRANPVIRPLYERLLAEGMEKMAAIGVCMHKTLRIVYGMLKHKQAFDPEIDRRYRERSASRRPSAGPDRRRRYQGFDLQAPVSRRASKKRQQPEHSQSEVVAGCGMLPLAAASVVSTPSAQPKFSSMAKNKSKTA